MKSDAPDLHRIQRGLAGYISYLAACDVNTVFSEYLLYEPILRILVAQNYAVECEAICPGIPQPTRGDKKRLDFRATKDDAIIAIEVKWKRDEPLDATSDYEKLAAFVTATRGGQGYLCVFGRESHLQQLTLSPGEFTEANPAVVADFGTTRFGCRVFEIVPPAALPAPMERAAAAR